MDTTFTATGATTADNASFFILHGAALSLPGLQTYVKTSCSSPYWTVSGSNSVLMLPALTNVVANNCSDGLHLQAQAGGRLVLTNVATLDGAVYVLADGTNSMVDLSNLTQLSGSPQFAVGRGGKILLPRPTQLDQVTLVIRNTGFIPTAQLRAITRSTVTIDGATVSFTSLANTNGTRFIFQNGGQMIFPLQWT